MKQSWEEIENELQKVMSCHVGVLREIVSNIEQEYQALLFKNSQELESILEERHLIIESMQNWRKKLAAKIESWKENHPVSTFYPTSSIDYVDLMSLNNCTNCTITLLRDQIVHLVEQIDQKNLRNQQLTQIGPTVALAVPKRASETRIRLMTMAPPKS